MTELCYINGTVVPHYPFQENGHQLQMLELLGSPLLILI